jgi:O-antigen ligase
LEFKIQPFHWFVAAYAAALMLSSIFSTQPSRSFIKLAGEFYLFGLSFISYSFVRDSAFVKRIVYAFLAGTSITILASLAGFVFFYFGYKTQADNFFLSHVGSLPAGNYPRIHALFANANMMCNFLNVTLMLSLLSGYLGWIRKWLSLVLTTGIWFAAILTFSTGLGGMLLSTGLWFGTVYAGRKNEVFKSRLIKFVGIAAAILILAAACVSPDTANTAQDFTVPGVEQKLEPSVRILVWQDSIRTFSEYPILGKGTGIDPANVFYSTLSGQNQILSDAHNMYLSVLGQAGLIGFVAFAGLLVFLIRRFKFEIGDERATIETALSCAIAGALLYQGLTGSFEDARHLWILIGMFAGISAYDLDSRLSA